MAEAQEAFEWRLITDVNRIREAALQMQKDNVGMKKDWISADLYQLRIGILTGEAKNDIDQLVNKRLGKTVHQSEHDFYLNDEAQDAIFNSIVHHVAIRTATQHAIVKHSHGSGYIVTSESILKTKGFKIQDIEGKPGQKRAVLTR